MDTPVGEQEIILLLNDLLDLYGYDFTDYSKASLSRRMSRLFLLDKITDFDLFVQLLVKWKEAYEDYFELRDKQK